MKRRKVADRSLHGKNENNKNTKDVQEYKKKVIIRQGENCSLK